MPGKESRQRIEKAFENSDMKENPKQKQIVVVGGIIRATLRLCKNDKNAMDLILLYEPERIHTLVPDVLLLRYLMVQYGAQKVTFSHYGVREGYLHQKIQPSLPDNS